MAKKKSIAKKQNFKKQFEEVVKLIEKSKENIYRSVNRELIHLYWKVGEYISRKVYQAEWGEGIIDQLAAYIERTIPEIRGFNRRGLYRMKLFYENYAKKNLKFVTAVLTQISWTNHLLIISKCKTARSIQRFRQRNTHTL